MLLLFTTWQNKGVIKLISGYYCFLTKRKAKRSSVIAGCLPSSDPNLCKYLNPLEALVPVLDIFRLALLNRQLNKIYCDMIGEEGRSPRGSETLQKLNALLVSSSIVHFGPWCFSRWILTDGVSTTFFFLKVEFLGKRSEGSSKDTGVPGDSKFCCASVGQRYAYVWYKNKCFIVDVTTYQSEATSSGSSCCFFSYDSSGIPLELLFF